MKTNLTIHAVEMKTQKNGKPYTSFTTSSGKMSVFDAKVADCIKPHVGKTIECEVTQNGNFSNITGFYAVTDVQPTPHTPAHQNEVMNVGVEEHVTQPRMSMDEARRAKDAMMLTSYAKDIFCRIYDSTATTATFAMTMEMAIQLTQQARDAFASGDLRA